jgi:hypothetical protein
MTVRPDRWGPLLEPQFRLLWIGQAISAVGDRISPVALASGVLSLNGSTGGRRGGHRRRRDPLAILLLVGVTGPTSWIGAD